MQKWGRGVGPPKRLKVKALRVELSIVENLSGLRGNIFRRFRRPRFNYRNENQEIMSFSFAFCDSPIFPLFPTLGQWLFGVCAGVICISILLSLKVEPSRQDREHQGRHVLGAVVDEICCIWRLPRPVSHYARGEKLAYFCYIEIHKRLGDGSRLENTLNLLNKIYSMKCIVGRGGISNVMYVCSGASK